MGTIFIGSLAVLLLLYIAIPRGNTVHEIIHLPLFWARMLVASKSGFEARRLYYGPHPRQYYLLLQAGAGRCSGTVIYFHGGSWRFGSPEAFRIHGEVFAREGFRVIMPSVRRIPRYNFLDFREDLRQFTLHLQGILDEAQPAPLPIIIGGMSSGAHLAAQLLFQRSILREAGIPSSRLSGLFLCGAPLDLVKMPDTPVIRCLAGRRGGPLFGLANPVNQLHDPPCIPVLFIHGTKDGLTPIENAISFETKLRAVHGGDIEFHILPGGTHLDAGSWGHTDNALRKLLTGWVIEKAGHRLSTP